MVSGGERSSVGVAPVGTLFAVTPVRRVTYACDTVDLLVSRDTTAWLSLLGLPLNVNVLAKVCHEHLM